jgi:hypothetical protein
MREKTGANEACIRLEPEQPGFHRNLPIDKEFKHVQALDMNVIEMQFHFS